MKNKQVGMLCPKLIPLKGIPKRELFHNDGTTNFNFSQSQLLSDRHKLCYFTEVDGDLNWILEARVIWIFLWWPKIYYSKTNYLSLE